MNWVAAAGSFVITCTLAGCIASRLAERDPAFSAVFGLTAFFVFFLIHKGAEEAWDQSRRNKEAKNGKG